MTPLVDRLREIGKWMESDNCECVYCQNGRAALEGAAEIERLRAILHNVALAIGADDSAEFRRHIGLDEQSTRRDDFSPENDPFPGA